MQFPPAVLRNPIVRFFLKFLRTFSRIYQYVRNKVHEFVELILERLVILLCRYYQRDHFNMQDPSCY